MEFTTENRRHSDSDTLNVWKRGAPECARCGNIIYDKTVLRVMGKTWHPACVKCSVCNKSLDKACYSNGHNLLCYEDFLRTNTVYCSSCKLPLSNDDLIHRVYRNIYHQNCFKCVCCDTKLQPGDRFYLRDDEKLVCQNDFYAMKLKYQEESDSECSTGSGKRFRTSISSHQLQCLISEYNKSPKPSRESRKRLSRKLGLDCRVIQVWFQNRRAKNKRSTESDVNKSHQEQGHPHSIYHGQDNTLLRHETLFKNQTRKYNINDWLTTILAPDSVPPNMEVSPVDIRNGEILRQHQEHGEIPPNDNSHPAFRSSCQFQRLI